MRTALTLGLAALTLTGVAGPALAQASSQADRADVRCMLVLELIGRDPKQQVQARSGVYYYLGKLNARGSIARLESVMLAEGKGMNTQAIVQGELARCGTELNQKTGEFQALNQKLAAQARPATAAPAPPLKK
jgi:hypothetical protein